MEFPPILAAILVPRSPRRLHDIQNERSNEIIEQVDSFARRQTWNENKMIRLITESCCYLQAPVKYQNIPELKIQLYNKLQEF